MRYWYRCRRAPASAQTARRDGIAELIAKDVRVAQTAKPPLGPPAPGAAAAPPQPADPREGDEAYEQARRLMLAIDAVLQDTAEQRGEAQKLPGRDEFIVTPLWTETREDRESGSAICSIPRWRSSPTCPSSTCRGRSRRCATTSATSKTSIATLKEKQLTAPKDGVLPGVLTDTVDSLDRDVAETEKRIELNKDEIAKTKAEVDAALAKSGVELSPEQVDLLLDGVLSGDLVRLVAVFNAAKVIDGQLARMLTAAGDNMEAARKYFAMHAALFAMLVHAQDSAIAKIDENYMPKLDAIMKDIAAAQAKTARLLQAENRPDQRRALQANRDAQKVAAEAARGYRRYLQQQREQIANARSRATHDLRIADNTYETVEASFQLKNLMRDSAASFEAIQRLEAPTFDQIFKNEELRREFENLTRKLDAPSS